MKSKEKKTRAVVATVAAMAFSAIAGEIKTPYGVCAHLHRVRDSEERAEECRLIASTGIGRVRFDLEWWRIQKERGGEIDFTHYDAVISDAEKAGLIPLPILYDIPKWANPVWEHLEEWGKFIEAVVEHYGERLPEIEIWNEENLQHFWKHEPDARRYTETLKVAYESAHRAAERSGRRVPRVFFGGTAGVPLRYIRQAYEAGAGRYFDAMNVHPYSHPRQPEGALDTQLEALRALMAEYGDGEKPIVITELGWPTHDARLDAITALLAGLKVAGEGRERESWRAVYAATDIESAELHAAILQDVLPVGSTCDACIGGKLRERLSAGDVDLVIYPFDETFPVDTFDAVEAFVKRGGVLMDAGGMPMWFGVREKSPGVMVREEDKTGAATKTMREALRICETAWWIDPVIPQNDTRVFPTECAKAVGYKGDPAGEVATRYQTAGRLEEGDEFIPLLTAKDEQGREISAVSVTHLKEGGYVIISGLKQRGAAGSAGEGGQARYLTRSMALAFAEGVTEYYWYEYRGREIDPNYSEDHFGLTHQNFTPKPAWGAYKNFVLARPAGSEQLTREWRDADGRIFYPQWRRPDGTVAGVIWTTGEEERREMRFAGDGVRFRDYTGRLVRPQRTGEGCYKVRISGEPVFFEGFEFMP